METSECEVCGGARWVCEDHPDKPWDGASDREDAWSEWLERHGIGDGWRWASCFVNARLEPA